MRNIPREIADKYQDLFNLLNQEHDLILTISEMDEIILEVQKLVENFSIAPVSLDEQSEAAVCTHCYGTGKDHGDESMKTDCSSCK